MTWFLSYSFLYLIKNINLDVDLSGYLYFIIYDKRYDSNFEIIYKDRRKKRNTRVSFLFLFSNMHVINICMDNKSCITSCLKAKLITFVLLIKHVVCTVTLVFPLSASKEINACNQKKNIVNKVNTFGWVCFNFFVISYDFLQCDNAVCFRDFKLVLKSILWHFSKWD